MKKIIIISLFLNLFANAINAQFPCTDPICPDDEFSVFSPTAYIPGGTKATCRVTVYKSPKTTEIKNPIIFIEGLDINNHTYAKQLILAMQGYLDPLFSELGWQKGPNLANSLLNNGYDIFIVDFTDARGYIQDNSFCVAEAIKKINEMKVGNNSNVVIGASMGGIVGRYALSYMEKNAMDHQTGLFVSFDSPQQGANIPLGDQYFIDFFAKHADEGSLVKGKSEALNTIAPQQLLYYHSASFPNVNPYRTALLNELAVLGYPKKCRNISIANGSPSAIGQGFQPGTHLIHWKFESAAVNIYGNVWALPNGNTSQEKVYDCQIDKAGYPNYHEWKPFIQPNQVQPYDNAPGSLRTTNLEIANGETEISIGGVIHLSGGDIKTDYPTHCFIPTISALDINTSDLNYNIKGDPNILSKTPFNAIYYPGLTSGFSTANQPHVSLTNENFKWIVDELIPDHLVLDKTTKNVGDIRTAGEVRAKEYITLLPGFQSEGNSLFNAVIYSPDFSVPSTPAITMNSRKEANTTHEAIHSNTQVTIFPNPSSGNFTIDASNSNVTRVQVYNLMGVVVYDQQNQGSTINLDLSDQAKGLYTIKISTDTEIGTQRIVVE